MIIRGVKKQAVGFERRMAAKTHRQEAPENLPKQMGQIPPVFDASHKLEMRNGGGLGEYLKQCTTIGRPQHI